LEKFSRKQCEETIEKLPEAWGDQDFPKEKSGNASLETFQKKGKNHLKLRRNMVDVSGGINTIIHCPLRGVKKARKGRQGRFQRGGGYFTKRGFPRREGEEKQRLSMGHRTFGKINKED